MTKNGVIVFFGVVTIASLGYGAYAFGRILTERPVPTIDEQLELLKQHQTLNNQFDRTNLIKQFGAVRRPLFNLNFAAAGDCETLLDSAEYYLEQADGVSARHPGETLQSMKNSGNTADAALIDSYTLVATHMADAYDDCLGNP